MPMPQPSSATAAEGLHRRLVEVLGGYGDLTIAVSGGIDSLTLAFVAHRFAGSPVAMLHAVSPAVPALATARVRDYAAREAWRLSVVEAGEFADPAYRANPLDRCYFCKSHLYDCARLAAGGTIASGTNLDDLGDFRPGLKAAAERRVVHPFVDSGIDKQGIRALARWHGLDDIAELPAQPCLASRVETGIGITAGDLAFIDDIEVRLRRALGPTAVVRCRVTRAGVVVELEDAGSQAVTAATRLAEPLCRDSGRRFAGVRPYRQGSAFLKTGAA